MQQKSLVGRLHLAEGYVSVAIALLVGCGEDARHVEITSFNVSQTTVAVGETFEVSWKTKHSNLPGDIYAYGLYVAEAQRVEALESLLQDGALTSIFRNGNLVKDPGKITCTRKSTTEITCTPIGALRATDLDVATLSGSHPLTFAACVSYVLDDDDICDTRQVELQLP
jgi:hypothetical protein